MANRQQDADSKKSLEYHTPEDSLKHLLQALCGVSIDTLRFTDDGWVDVYIADKRQRAEFKEQFAMLFNFPQLFDQKVANYAGKSETFKPYMYDPPLSQYARRYSEAPTVKGALSFLKSLIPSEDHSALTELQDQLGNADTRGGKLISPWYKQTGQQIVKKRSLEAAIERIANYFSTYISLQRIQDRRQSGRPLPLGVTPHLIPEQKEDLPIARHQTPFITSDDFHKIFKIERPEQEQDQKQARPQNEGEYRLVVDIQRLYDLIEPVRVSTNGDCLRVGRREIARRFAQFLKPHGGVIAVDGKPIFAEDFQGSKTTIQQQKRIRRYHLVLDYSFSMKAHARELTKQVQAHCSKLLEQGIGVDITYFYESKITQCSFNIENDSVKTQEFSLNEQREWVSCATNYETGFSLPITGSGGTPLHQAVNLALKQTASNDRLMIFTDGVPSEGDAKSIEFPSQPPECKLIGYGEATKEWLEKVQGLWAEQGQKYKEEISCDVEVSDNMQTVMQHIQRTVSFTDKGVHQVTLPIKFENKSFDVPQGAGPIQSRHFVSPDFKEESAPDVSPICNPSLFDATPITHYDFSGGHVRLSTRPGSISDFKKEFRMKWLKNKWKELSENEDLSFLQKAQTLLEAYSKQYSCQEKVGNVRYRTVYDLMSALTREPASSKSDPMVIALTFLRTQYVESKNCEGDIPWPTIDHLKREGNSQPSSESTPLLVGQPQPDRIASPSSQKLLATSTLWINYRINNRVKEISQKWTTLAETQPSNGLDEKEQNPSGEFQVDCNFIQALAEDFILKQNKITWFIIWLAGYRSAYQQAKQIIQGGTDDGVVSMINDLSALLPDVGRSSYLHVFIMFLKHNVLTSEQQSSHLTKIVLPDNFQLDPLPPLAEVPPCGLHP